MGVSSLRFTLPAGGPVTIRLYDVQGRETVTLLDGVRSAGTHSVTLDPAPLRSGVYFCRLASPAGVASLKVLVLR